MKAVFLVTDIPNDARPEHVVSLTMPLEWLEAITGFDFSGGEAGDWADITPYLDWLAKFSDQAANEAAAADHQKSAATLLDYPGKNPNGRGKSGQANGPPG